MADSHNTGFEGILAEDANIMRLAESAVLDDMQPKPKLAPSDVSIRLLTPDDINNPYIADALHKLLWKHYAVLWSNKGHVGEASSAQNYESFLHSLSQDLKSKKTQMGMVSIPREQVPVAATFTLAPTWMSTELEACRTTNMNLAPYKLMTGLQVNNLTVDARHRGRDIGLLCNAFAASQATKKGMHNIGFSAPCEQGKWDAEGFDLLARPEQHYHIKGSMLSLIPDSRAVPGAQAMTVGVVPAGSFTNGQVIPQLQYLFPKNDYSYNRDPRDRHFRENIEKYYSDSIGGIPADETKNLCRIIVTSGNHYLGTCLVSAKPDLAGLVSMSDKGVTGGLPYSLHIEHIKTYNPFTANLGETDPVVMAMLAKAKEHFALEMGCECTSIDLMAPERSVTVGPTLRALGMTGTERLSDKDFVTPESTTRRLSLLLSQQRYMTDRLRDRPSGASFSRN